MFRWHCGMFQSDSSVWCRKFRVCFGDLGIIPVLVTGSVDVSKVWLSWVTSNFWALLSIGLAAGKNKNANARLLLLLLESIPLLTSAVGVHTHVQTCFNLTDQRHYIFFRKKSAPKI